MLDVTVRPFNVAKGNGRKPRGVLRIGSRRQLEGLNTSVIVQLHNAFTTGLPVDRFPDRQTAIEKTWALVKDHVRALSTEPEEDDMATETKEKKAPARKAGEETPVVKTVIKLLKRKNGATKTELQEALPETKEGYINALLSRILKEKGYTLTSEAVEGQRAKRYHVSGEPTAAAE